MTCHDGTDGEWPLSTRSHLIDWRFDIRTRMLDCSMPPPDSGVTMTTEERELLLDWIRCGVPE
ncbi:hypothetical protein D3C83_129360 [compost metagenome]